MGRVEDGQPVDDLGVVHRERPGGGSTPVVAGHERGLGAALLDEPRTSAASLPAP
jgi:hypothetical protein